MTCLCLDHFRNKCHGVRAHTYIYIFKNIQAFRHDILKVIILSKIYRHWLALFHWLCCYNFVCSFLFLFFMCAATLIAGRRKRRKLERLTLICHSNLFICLFFSDSIKSQWKTWYNVMEYDSLLWNSEFIHWVLKSWLQLDSYPCTFSSVLSIFMILLFFFEQDFY